MENEKSLKVVIEALDELFNRFNKEVFGGELQKPILTVNPDQTKGAYGWCTTWKAWRDSTMDEKESGYYEINICAEHLARPFSDVCGTLLHEMVHLLNLQIGVKDCSRNGTYHNTKFRDEALKRGLTVEQTEKYGWSKTKLTEDMEKIVNDFRNKDFEIYRSKVGKPVAKKKSSSKKYFCEVCGASVRATKEVRIMCMICDEEMECDE